MNQVKKAGVPREISTCSMTERRKVMANLDSILKSRDIALPTKVHLVKAMVFPVVLYGCESWTIKKAEGQKSMLLFFFIFYFLFFLNFFLIFKILKSLILTCVPKHEPPSQLPPHNISLGHPHAPAPSMLHPTSDFGPFFFFYQFVTIFFLFLKF